MQNAGLWKWINGLVDFVVLEGVDVATHQSLFLVLEQFQRKRFPQRINWKRAIRVHCVTLTL